MFPGLADTSLGSPGWRPNQGSPYYPDPFADYASLAMPRSNTTALQWCEFLMNSDSVYREATRRTLAYFITDIKIKGSKGDEIGRDEREKYETFFREVLDMQYVLHCVGLDYLTYGNSFNSLYVPFTRSVACPKCEKNGRYNEVPIKSVLENKHGYHYRWENFGFHLKCHDPNCQYEGEWRVVDRRTDGDEGFVIRRYRPQDIDILFSPASEACQYIWRIPEDERQGIRTGLDHVLEDTPWEIVRAVKESANLRFMRGSICHMKEPTLAGVRSRGWGVSRVLVNFRHAWYVRVLHRFNEAIALDYIIPLRVVTPDPKSGPMIDGATDPLKTLDMGDWRGQVEAAITNRRFDPLQWSFFPFPLQYQILGGEARQLAPFELMDQAVGMHLNSAGYPVQFYKMDLTTQSAIPGARLFEATQAPLVHMLNGFLRFFAKKVADLRGWEPASAQLVPPSFMDDIQSAAAKINLATQRMVSKTTALKAMNLDNREEQRQILDDEAFEAEEQAKSQQEMQQSSLMDEMANPPQQPQPGAAVGGLPGLPGGQVGMPPGGQGGGGQPAAGPNAAAAQSFNTGMPTSATSPSTPQDVMSKADSIARDLLSRPEAERASALIQLKKTDPVTHPYIKDRLETIRQQAASQGKALVLKQQLGGG